MDTFTNQDDIQRTCQGCGLRLFRKNTRIPNCSQGNRDHVYYSNYMDNSDVAKYNNDFIHPQQSLGLESSKQYHVTENNGNHNCVPMEVENNREMYNQDFNNMNQNDITDVTNGYNYVKNVNDVTTQLDDIMVLPEVGLWHVTCLRCRDCGENLREHCFNHPEEPRNVYCFQHFFRRYGARCVACSDVILPSEISRRAKNFLYHKDCFNCSICDVTILTGQLFYLSMDGELLCTTDFQNLKDKSQNSIRTCQSPEPPSAKNVIHYPPTSEDLRQVITPEDPDVQESCDLVSCSCEPETIPAHMTSSLKPGRYKGSFTLVTCD